MKKLVLLLALCPSFAFAQEKVEQYCELISQNKLLSNKVTIEVDFGEEKRGIFSRTPRIKDELGKVKTFNTTIAALNYMGSIGWKFVDAYPVSDAGTTKTLHYYFKREFDKSELEEVK
jgi:hypothetical protein